MVHGAVCRVLPCVLQLLPARRRVQRLSYSIWAMIRRENADLQGVLQARSTSERLRMALLRLRELRAQVDAAGDR